MGDFPVTRFGTRGWKAPGTGRLESLPYSFKRTPYDALFRRSSLALGGTSYASPTYYTYDAASRLLSVSDGTNSATYSYLANSHLVSNIVFQQASTTRMTTSKQHDNLGRLTSIGSVSSVSSVVSSAYAYNLANQRTAVTNADGSYWLYSYDTLGQVTSGKRYWSDGVVVEGQQFEYGFDDIGNRRTASAGGDASGANLRQASYFANALNQYTSRTVPPYLEVQGTAATNATVTVNNQATYRKGEYFRKELAALNADYPLWLGITNLAVVNDGSNPDIVTTNQGHLFLGKTPEVFTHDADGNLKENAEWKLTWDGENRLIAAETTFNAAAAGKPRQKLEFAYDSKSRRIQKQVYLWETDHWTLITDSRFAYDGWNLISVLTSDLSPQTSFLWGTDLSGSMQGGGGVGGLLAVSNHQSPTGTHFAAYDGNENLTALVSAADGTESARYEYGPFHEVLRATGPLAFLNPFRASTKYQDDETGWLYYGYRYYDSSTGRWLNRDPLEEYAGPLLYGFVSNDPRNYVDPFGLKCSTDRFTWDLESPEALEKLEKRTGFGIKVQAQGRIEIKTCDAVCPCTTSKSVEWNLTARGVVDGSAELDFFLPGPLAALKPFIDLTFRVQGTYAAGAFKRQDACTGKWSGGGVQKFSFLVGLRLSTSKRVATWVNIYGQVEAQGTFQSEFICSTSGCNWGPWTYSVNVRGRVGFQSNIPFGKKTSYEHVWSWRHSGNGHVEE